MGLSAALLMGAAGCAPAPPRSFHDEETSSAGARSGRPALPPLREGDLLVRRGRGLLSDLFRRVGGKEALYSHVGIVHLGGGEPRVIHTVASELSGRGHARVDPLHSFLSEDRADAAALYRPVGASPEVLRSAVEAALEMAALQTPFDTAFDLETEDRLYCTELVQLAYRRAGLPLVEASQLVPLRLRDRRDPLLVLTMESLLRSEHIRLVWTQERRD